MESSRITTPSHPVLHEVDLFSLATHEAMLYPANGSILRHRKLREAERLPCLLSEDSREHHDINSAAKQSSAYRKVRPVWMHTSHAFRSPTSPTLASSVAAKPFNGLRWQKKKNLVGAGRVLREPSLSPSALDARRRRTRWWSRTLHFGRNGGAFVRSASTPCSSSASSTVVSCTDGESSQSSHSPVHLRALHLHRPIHPNASELYMKCAGKMSFLRFFPFFSDGIGSSHGFAFMISLCAVDFISRVVAHQAMSMGQYEVFHDNMEWIMMEYMRLRNICLLSRALITTSGLWKGCEKQAPEFSTADIPAAAEATLRFCNDMPAVAASSEGSKGSEVASHPFASLTGLKRRIAYHIHHVITVFIFCVVLVYAVVSLVQVSSENWMIVAIPLAFFSGYGHSRLSLLVELVTPSLPLGRVSTALTGEEGKGKHITSLKSGQDEDEDSWVSPLTSALYGIMSVSGLFSCLLQGLRVLLSSSFSVSTVHSETAPQTVVQFVSTGVCAASLILFVVIQWCAEQRRSTLRRSKEREEEELVKVRRREMQTSLHFVLGEDSEEEAERKEESNAPTAFFSPLSTLPKAWPAAVRRNRKSLRCSSSLSPRADNGSPPPSGAANRTPSKPVILNRNTYRPTILGIVTVSILLSVFVVNQCVESFPLCVTLYAYSELMLLAFTFWALPLPVAKAALYSFLYEVTSVSLTEPLWSFFMEAEACNPGGPHFSYFFYNTVTGFVGNLSGLLGVALFAYFFAHRSYRFTFLVLNALSMLCNLVDVVIVRRWNRWLFGDCWAADAILFLVGDVVLAEFLWMMNWMPVMIMLTKVCPSGTEAMVYSVLAGISQLGIRSRKHLAHILVHYTWPLEPSVPPCNYTELWKMLLLAGVVIPLVILLPLMPLLVPEAKLCEELDEHGCGIPMFEDTTDDEEVVKEVDEC